MTKAVKSFAVSLAIVAAVLAPACRTKKKPQTVPAMETTASVPQVPTMTTTTATTATAAPNTDFVQTDTQPQVTTTQLPTDIEELNRVAQNRGYIQDAFFGFDESTLSADAQSALSASADWLKKNGQ